MMWCATETDADATVATKAATEIKETSKAATRAIHDTRWGWQPGLATELANPRLVERCRNLGPRDHKHIQREVCEVYAHGRRGTGNGNTI